MTASGRDADDEQRFAEWVHEHGKAIRGFLGALLRSRDLADELSQDVFCRAWQARLRYRDQGNPRAYLLRIADRLACDHVRRSGTHVQLDEAAWKRLEPAGEGTEPWEAIQRAEDARELAAALDRLSSAQRRVLLLRYYGQLSFAEIAEMTGWPLNTTLSHCHRGLETLRKLLVEQGP